MSAEPTVRLAAAPPSDAAPAGPVEGPPATQAGGLERLLTPHEAAKLLAVSQSWLWQNTAPRGVCVPCLKLGRAVRYAPADLREFLGRLRREAN